MWKFKQVKALVVGSVLAVSGWGGVIPQSLAQDSTSPAQVVSDYVESLVSGDIDQLNVLLGGTMKETHNQVFLYPETYSPFLKERYANAQVTVEEIVPEGSARHARVRFDYPGSESVVVVLILSQVDGQWKITDELSAE